MVVGWFPATFSGNSGGPERFLLMVEFRWWLGGFQQHFLAILEGQILTSLKTTALLYYNLIENGQFFGHRGGDPRKANLFLL